MKTMYSDDSVLVAYLPTPADLDIIRQQNWYRIPQANAPTGFQTVYYAFYLGKKFGPEKWSIPYFAKQLGHELVQRKTLLPTEANHPRANTLYYKVQLGPLQRLERPIISLRWRRVTFFHTTFDRLLQAEEINDLLLKGGGLVKRRAP
ncbi:MAG TPA: hypothetical protein VLL52_18690 [Anaerolineae bacterium]|nr:hypothetical protein [Anaerolineae bacterium]